MFSPDYSFQQNFANPMNTLSSPGKSFGGKLNGLLRNKASEMNLAPANFYNRKFQKPKFVFEKIEPEEEEEEEEEEYQEEEEPVENEEEEESQEEKEEEEELDEREEIKQNKTSFKRKKKSKNFKKFPTRN